MLALRTTSVAGTRAVAAALAELAEPGDVLLLTGDLGAGKTAFAQGFGRSLGVVEPITSPTFTLHRRYEGRLRMEHLDVYRLEQIEEAADLDLAGLVEGGSVTLVEWGDKILPALPAEHLDVELSLGEGDDERLIRLHFGGPRWRARRAAVARALAPWQAGEHISPPVEPAPC